MARAKISSNKSTKSNRPNKEAAQESKKLNQDSDICLKAELEKDRDFKANIYQQLIDLQPFLSEESQVAVAIHVSPPKDDEPKRAAEYALTLSANIGELRLESEGRDSDRYVALSLAKQSLLLQLDALHGAAIDSRERNAQIVAFSRGEMTLH